MAADHERREQPSSACQTTGTSRLSAASDMLVLSSSDRYRLVTLS
jgi:hypothetical protein